MSQLTTFLKLKFCKCYLQLNFHTKSVNFRQVLPIRQNSVGNRDKILQHSYKELTLSRVYKSRKILSRTENKILQYLQTLLVQGATILRDSQAWSLFRNHLLSGVVLYHFSWNTWTTRLSIAPFNLVAFLCKVTWKDHKLLV